MTPGPKTEGQIAALKEELDDFKQSAKYRRKQWWAIVWWLVAAAAAGFAFYVLVGALDAAKAGREFSTTLTLVGVGMPIAVAVFSAHKASGEATHDAFGKVVSLLRRGRKAAKGE